MMQLPRVSNLQKNLQESAKIYEKAMGRGNINEI